MANPVSDFFNHLVHRSKSEAPTRSMAGQAVDSLAGPHPAAAPSPLSAAEALTAFLSRLKPKVEAYLESRNDGQEQQDHLNHVAARTRWLYRNELQRQTPGGEVTITAHDNDLIEACVFSHDMGKWIPRDELRTIFTDEPQALEPIFRELRFSRNQQELFLLGVRRRFHLPQDGFTPEYDAAHHLASAYMLVMDPHLGFHALAPADQTQLINMVVGHQFGSYFKGSLLNISLYDREVTTGMLVDSARSDRLQGDSLSSVFHDADISDLLFVGSVENLSDGAERFHSGGLVKILLINFTNLLHSAPQAPTNLEEVLNSCQSTVNNACKEFLTPTAIECGHVWRDEARQFLNFLHQPGPTAEINAALQAAGQPPSVRRTAVRGITYAYAMEFLKDPERHSS
jgi:hypothetical protein